MGSIYLIRHGQASFGADDYDVLSATGVRQAEVLGEHLASLGLRFDRCVAGDLRRQRHTAEAVMGRLNEAGIATPTQSQLITEKFGTGSVAEAAALAAAGPRARLITTRTVSQDRTATAAIAEGDGP